ncbi:MAG: tetratricopeptide repeat protein [Spirochaetaceae bacterium]|jgi:Ca-activated chloride channel family protein|nr:tetratricopeptide repeat protein [Spirochaetaceae bacterium]
MTIPLERPWALLLLGAILPAVVNLFLRLRGLKKVTSLFNQVNQQYLQMKLIFSALLRMLAWVMLTLGVSGLTWGTRQVPSRRQGGAAAFVFDISWSMTAPDCPNGATRLEGAASYARALISRMEGTPLSVVLAKGDGIIAVPLTADINAPDALLGQLSPHLMSSAGSSIGRGIDAAIRSFPPALGAMPVILVFTDGEETDDRLAESTENALKQGIPVVFIGFGGTVEREIIAGDGTTRVKTALRAEKLQGMADRWQHSALIPAKALYVDSADAGSALRVLRAALRGQRETGVVFEVVPVSRYRFFLLAALLLFIISVILSEWHPTPRREGRKKQRLPGAVPLVILLGTLAAIQGCENVPNHNSLVKNMFRILEGTVHWRQADYPEAILDFLTVTEEAQKFGDAGLLQYGLAALASSYLMQGEWDAALSRLQEIPGDAPAPVRFAALYNTGLIAFHRGNYDEAQECFRQALEIDGTSVDAKINLELAGSQGPAQVNDAVQEIIPAEITRTEQKAAQNALFSIIRESEQNRWKNNAGAGTESGVLDY